jgi:hypothetical protein
MKDENRVLHFRGIDLCPVLPPARKLLPPTSFLPESSGGIDWSGRAGRRLNRGGRHGGWTMDANWEGRFVGQGCAISESAEAGASGWGVPRLEPGNEDCIGGHSPPYLARRCLINVGCIAIFALWRWLR